MWRNYLSIPKLQWLQHWSLGMAKYFYPTLCDECNYLPMLGLKVIHVSKTTPRWQSNLFGFHQMHNESIIIIPGSLSGLFLLSLTDFVMMHMAMIHVALDCGIQYIQEICPWLMLQYVVLMWLIFCPYSSGWLHWHCGAIIRLPQCQWSNPEGYR